MNAQPVSVEMTVASSTPELPKTDGFTLAETFRRARSRAVPLIGLETPDPAASVKQCLAALNGNADKTITCLWDISRGVTGCNEAGKAFAAGIPEDLRPMLRNPAECLIWLSINAPSKGLFFFANASRFYDAPDVLQGIWNLRDVFKGNGATLVLLSPMIRLPAELSRDIAVITEELPTEQDITRIVDSLTQDTKAANETFVLPDEDTKPIIVDTMLGLSAFEAEQALALSITKSGVDTRQLWQLKVKAIEQTPGLSVWQGGESFDDIGGLTNLKAFLSSVCQSPVSPVRAILYVDEIEKSLAGAAGDTSGTSQDQLGTLLKVMQDENLPGIILLGHCGCGKSAIAKAAGTMADAPVIACDLGAMKGSLVGQSEQRIRAAMDVFKAISQGKGIVIATCNKINSLPPELRRRFSLGIFMVDLPDADEQATIWPMWIKRYKLTEQELPESESWSGAEIRACCDVAFRTGLTLKEAAKFIVPVIKSAPDQVKTLRQQANGRYISASKAGVYEWPPKQTATRKLDLA